MCRVCVCVCVCVTLNLTYSSPTRINFSLPLYISFIPLSLYIFESPASSPCFQRLLPLFVLDIPPCFRPLLPFATLHLQDKPVRDTYFRFPSFLPRITLFIISIFLSYSIGNFLDCVDFLEKFELKRMCFF